MEFLFWSAAALLVYAYAGYPLLVTLVAAGAPRRIAGTQDVTPSVTIVVTVYNEAARIESRLDNLLALDYPPEKVEIFVGSDGSDDGTVELARRYAARNVHVFAFAFRRGKPAMLNDLIPRASADIVVLADARQPYAPDALKQLVAGFGDPAVGAISGELVLGEPSPGTAVGGGVGLYWRYEKHIRRAEARVDSTVGATGAIYALRRQLFEPIPPDTVLDDVLIPMQVVRTGHRVLFEGHARAFDRPSASGREEFTRKMRTITGLFQLFAAHPWLLSPLSNRLWLQTISHKALRLCGPVLLIAALASSAALADQLFYRMALLAQLAFYTAAAAGAAARIRGRVPRVLSLPFTFCLLNLATLAAIWRFAVAGQAVTWDRAAAADAVPDAVPDPPTWSGVRPGRAVRN
jgi:poly-beta-1,6-N-acetyl-D-glucosamine synthase